MKNKWIWLLVLCMAASSFIASCGSDGKKEDSSPIVDEVFRQNSDDEVSQEEGESNGEVGRQEAESDEFFGFAEKDTELKDADSQPDITEISDVEVVEAVSITKKVDPSLGSVVENHTVSIPKISGETDEVAAFNEKILRNHGDAVEILEYDLEGKAPYNGTLYSISYDAKVYDGIVGIMVIDGCSTIGSYFNNVYYGYYFDVNRNCELSYYEYLELLGVEYADMVETANAHITSESPDGELYRASTDIEERQVNCAIFDGSTARAVVPDMWSPATVTFDYVVTADVLENRSPDVSVATEALEGFYNSNDVTERIESDKRMLYGNYEASEITVENAYMADVDNDRCPELCVVCFEPMMNYNTYVFDYNSRTVYLKEVLYSGAGGSSGWNVELALMDDGSIWRFHSSSGSMVRTYSVQAPSREDCIGVSLSHSYDYDTGTTTYTIDGETATEEEYNSKEAFFDGIWADNRDKFIDEMNCSMYEVWDKQKNLQ